MPYEAANTAVACSWVGLFAAVWFGRNAGRDLDSDHYPAASQRRRQTRKKARADRTRRKNGGRIAPVEGNKDRLTGSAIDMSRLPE